MKIVNNEVHKLVGYICGLGHSSSCSHGMGYFTINDGKRMLHKEDGLDD